MKKILVRFMQMQFNIFLSNVMTLRHLVQLELVFLDKTLKPELILVPFV